MTTRSHTWLMFFGICMIAVAAFIICEHHVFKSHALVARATVIAPPVTPPVSFHGFYFDRGENTCLQFKTKSSKAEIGSANTWVTYEIGDKLNITYSQSKPFDLRIERFAERSALPAVLFFFGFTLLFTGMMKAGVLAIRNGSIRLALSAGSSPLSLRQVIQSLPQSGEVGRRDINIVSHQSIRLTDPATGETKTYDSLDQVPPDRRAEIENAMNTGLNAGTGSHAAETYVFKNPDGSDAVYHSLEEMPPEIRKIFESLHRR